jgi:hypothetical protein
MEMVLSYFYYSLKKKVIILMHLPRPKDHAKELGAGTEAKQAWGVLADCRGFEANLNHF